MEKGFVHIYTGNGKGKTTAALGLALRGMGAGFRIYMGQFMKDDEYSEIKTLRRKFSREEIIVEQFGAGLGFISKNEIDPRQLKAAANGYEKAFSAVTGGKYDLVILDEINVAAHVGLIREADILRLITEKPKDVELVLTGRYAAQSVIDAADLVTEMKEVKHYFQAGVNARIGIEK